MGPDSLDDPLLAWEALRTAARWHTEQSMGATIRDQSDRSTAERNAAAPFV
jgi:hypothetical protein